MTKKSAWNKVGKRQNKNGEVEKMARKDDILSIYTKEVEGIKEAGLFKGEAPFVSPQGARVKMEDGRELLCMCANNYLGLGDNPRLIEAAKRTYDEKGYGVASVRFICGTQDIHKKLEKKISGFLGTDDTILYSSCFDANGGLFETILTAEDAVISDELNHASIIDGVRLCKAKRFRYKNNDMKDLEAKLKEADEAGARIKLIATDGVFSMDGIICNLKGVCDLADKYFIHLEEVRNIVINGNGAVVNLLGAHQTFCNLRKCENISVQGFVIDYPGQMTFTQGRVIDSDTNTGTVDVELEPGFPSYDDLYFVGNLEAPVMLLDPVKNGKLKDGVPNYYQIDMSTIQKIRDRKYRLTFKNVSVPVEGKIMKYQSGLLVISRKEIALFIQHGGRIPVLFYMQIMRLILHFMI